MTLDVNTLLSGVILALVCWTLKTVNDVAAAQAAAREKSNAQDARIDENRSRVIKVEEKVNHLEVDVGKLQESSGQN